MKRKPKKKVMVNDHYPNNCREVMSKKDMTISELSRRLDMSRPYLTRVVNGQQLCYVTAAIAIARELGTNVENLWGDLDFQKVRAR